MLMTKAVKNKLNCRVSYNPDGLLFYFYKYEVPENNYSMLNPKGTERYRTLPLPSSNIQMNK